MPSINPWSVVVVVVVVVSFETVKLHDVRKLKLSARIGRCILYSVMIGLGNSCEIPGHEWKVIKFQGQFCVDNFGNHH